MDENIKEQLVNELVKHINDGGKAIEKIKEFQSKYPDTNKSIWKEIRKLAKERGEGSHEQQYKKRQEIARKESVKLVNEILSYATFRGSSLGSSAFRRLNEIDDKMRLLKPDGQIDSDKLNDLLTQAQIKLREADKLKEMKIIERIVDHLSEQQFMGKDEGEVRLINMALDRFYFEFGEVNYMDADDREEVYAFWEKVQDEYPKLVKAVEDLKNALKKLRTEDAGFQKLVDDLEVPPPYINQIGIIKTQFRSPLERFIEFLERLGARRPREGRTSYSRRTVRTGKGGGLRPELSERLPEKLPGGGRDERVTETTPQGTLYQEDIPLDINTSEIELDPILWDIWDELEVPAGFGEDLEEMLEQLSKLDSLEGEEKRLADLAIEELTNAVKDIPDSSIYLPVAQWLKDMVPGITDEIGEVNDKTGKFFATLNRLFLESGLFPVSIGTQYGGPQRGAAGGAVEISGKTDAQQFRRPRVQGTMDTLPEEKTDEYVKAVKEEWEELQKLLNSYYFHPISKGKFHNDEKPDFTDEGGRDYDAVKEGDSEIDEFDPGRTTQEGQYPYRALEFNFGTHPKAKTIKRLLLALDDNMFDTELLESLIELIQMLKGGFESVEGWNRYSQNIEEQVKFTLDKLLPDYKHENRVWAAGKIGEALIASQEETLLSEIKLFGKPIDDLYAEYVRWNDKDLPLSYLRSLLVSPEFENLMREDADFGESDDYKELVGYVKKILELTEPKEERTAKDEVDESRSALNKSLLKVHDYINKMNGLPIYYGKLNVSDVDDVDYLITKIENEDRVEVNCIEITSIVNSVDSHSNISKSFGIKESIIYKIKGLCR